jgi:hypothetical protein
MVASTDSRWDLSVNDRNGQLVLAVEVKSKIDASPEWAAELRRNILAHGTFPKAPYFLMVFPDKFYLWIDAEANSYQSQPNYTIDARPILKPYFERLQPFLFKKDHTEVTPNQMSKQNLQVVVTWWLGEIMYSGISPEDVDESQRWLIESGLYAALSGGKIDFEAFV